MEWKEHDDDDDDDDDDGTSNQRLESTMRNAYIRLHEQTAAQAAMERDLLGEIDTFTLRKLEWGRLLMPNHGLSHLAKDIEKEAGLE